MIGNAAEYVFDYFDPDYYSNSPSSNPVGPGPGLRFGVNKWLACYGNPNSEFTGAIMTIRGGSWTRPAEECTTTHRRLICSKTDPQPISGSIPVDQDFFVAGFRVVR